MSSEKIIIKEQKIKDVVEVWVVPTSQVFWEFTCKKSIKVYGNNGPKVWYIAFLRTGRRDGDRTAITHIAEVESTQSHVSKKDTYKGFPEIIKEWGVKGTLKVYELGALIPLSHEIPLLKGESVRRKPFKTTMGELLRVRSVGEIKH